MPVLIDGNNLLFAGRDANPEHPIGRGKLCELLGRWSRRTGETVSIVFDGPAPTGDLARQIGDPDIDVAYSAPVTADEILAEKIASHSAPRRLVVVSTDRQVAKSAARRRATPMRSADFWDVLLADLARAAAVRLEPLEKRTGLAPGAADDWIRELGLDDVVGPDDW